MDIKNNNNNMKSYKDNNISRKFLMKLKIQQRRQDEYEDKKRISRRKMFKTLKRQHNIKQKMLSFFYIKEIWNIICDYVDGDITLQLFQDILSLIPYYSDGYINIYRLNRNPAAIHLLEQNLDKIDWKELSENPSAIHLLEKNPHKFHKYNWQVLSRNPAAIHLLEQNLDKIDWYNLSRNPAAIHLTEGPARTPVLEKNPNKIFWNFLSININHSAILY